MKTGKHRFVVAPKHTLDDSVLDWLLEDEESADVRHANQNAA